MRALVAKPHPLSDAPARVVGMTDLMNPSPTPSAPVRIAAVSAQVEIMTFAAGPFATNCYILIDRSSDATRASDDGESQDHGATGNAPAVVIDPGYGAFDAVTELAREHEFSVEKVVLTHGHIDHFRDAGEFGVPVYVHPLDRPLIEMDLASLPFGHLFDVASMKEIGQLRDLAEAEVRLAGVDFAVHHVPGHSPGACDVPSARFYYWRRRTVSRGSRPHGSAGMFSGGHGAVAKETDE